MKIADILPEMVKAVKDKMDPKKVSQWDFFKVIAAKTVVNQTGDISDVQNPELLDTVRGLMLYEMMGTKMFKTRDRVEVV